MPQPKSEQMAEKKFQRADVKSPGKPDPPGRIAVRIIHVDPAARELQHKSGLRREDVVVEDATVGEVLDLITKALFDE